MNPKVLLFDEPISALDPEMTNDVINMIRNIATQGISILIVTHDLPMAKQVSNRILFLKHGKIIENRPMEEFFQILNLNGQKAFSKAQHCSNDFKNKWQIIETDHFRPMSKI
jgi:ABC-type polar amino acid transport system ATPase subunit